MLVIDPFKLAPVASLADITHVASATFNAGTLGSHSPTLPTFIAGDAVLMQATYPGNRALVTPTGWTLLHTTGGGSAGLGRQAVLLRVMQSGDASTVLLDWTGTDTARVAVAMDSYRNVDPTTPVDVSSAATVTQDNTPTAPDVTTVTAKTRVLRLFGLMNNSGQITAMTTPAGLTARAQLLNVQNMGVGNFDLTQAAAGATGTATSTLTATTAETNTNGGAVTLALRPATV